ncbi:MAG: nucleotidyl transferase AbiEii/AbiGii toxin family protein [Candidatus Eisenbacteria bacterium]
MGKPSDIGASVAARLLNRARSTGEDFQTLLTLFCLERFLCRVGVSPLRDQFVLKGALLLRVWTDHPYRATRDLDLLRRGDDSRDAIARDVRAICTVPVEPDGVEFDTSRLGSEPIRADDEYAGVRVTLPVRCGTAKLTLQIDIGVGDSVWPPPSSATYPTLLDFAAPEVLSYPKEAVVAEKLEALVVLGDRNSRIKDFFDLRYLATSFAFDRMTLAEAVRRTFHQRGTPIPTEPPIGLTPEYWSNPSRPTQVKAFARRARLEVSDVPGAEFVELLAVFLLPVLQDVLNAQHRDGMWDPVSGTWRSGVGQGAADA